MTAYVNYLQAGDIIPGWELIHPDDTSTNGIKFEPRRAEVITNTNLQGHLIRVRSETNNIVFIADRFPNVFRERKNSQPPCIHSKIGSQIQNGR